mgnify:CR=1 FL=1
MRKPCSESDRSRLGSTPDVSKLVPTERSVDTIQSVQKQIVKNIEPLNPCSGIGSRVATTYDELALGLPILRAEKHPPVHGRGSGVEQLYGGINTAHAATSTSNQSELLEHQTGLPLHLSNAKRWLDTVLTRDHCTADSWISGPILKGAR